MKKYLLIILVLLMLLLAGCQKVEPSLAPQGKTQETKKVETTEFKTLSSFPIQETFPEAQKSSRQFSVETLPLEEGFQIYDYDGDTTGKYSPKDNVLYLLTTDKPDGELMTHVMIYYLSTGEKKKVPLEQPYRYIDSEAITANGYEFIGTNNDDGIVNHVLVTKEGKIEQQEVDTFGGIAASTTGTGFITNTDEGSEKGYFSKMSFTPYGKEEVKKLFQEPFQIADNGKVIGSYLNYAYGVGDWIGFQLLNYSDKTVPEVKGSYLFDVDKKELYSFGFMKNHCHNIMGNKEFILTLEEEYYVNKKTNPERCKLYLYNEKTGGYEYTVLPGYDNWGYITNVNIINKNILVVDSFQYIDIVNLNNNQIYRWSSGSLQNITYLTYYDGYIYYFRQKDNGNYTMYYKELPHELLQGESTKG